MSGGIPGRRMLAVGVAIVSVGIAACDLTGAVDRAGDARPRRDEWPSAQWYAARPHVLRAERHAARGRVWVLHGHGVDIHDAAGERKIASIGLPGWTWADASDACPPDFAVGPGGDVVVTSNVMAVLWRIDASSLEVTRHHLSIEEHGEKEIGFSRLTYSARRNAFLATGAIDGSLWRIDPALVRAKRIAPPAGSADARPMTCLVDDNIDLAATGPR